MRRTSVNTTAFLPHYEAGVSPREKRASHDPALQALIKQVQPGEAKGLPEARRNCLAQLMNHLEHPAPPTPLLFCCLNGDQTPVRTDTVFMYWFVCKKGQQQLSASAVVWVLQSVGFKATPWTWPSLVCPGPLFLWQMQIFFKTIIGGARGGHTETQFLSPFLMMIQIGWQYRKQVWHLLCLAASTPQV